MEAIDKEKDREAYIKKCRHYCSVDGTCFDKNSILGFGSNSKTTINMEFKCNGICARMRNYDEGIR